MLAIRRRFAQGWLAALLVVLATGFGRWCRAESWTDWRVAGPFVCRADFPLEPLEDLLDDLGRLQADLVRHLGVQPAQAAIELYLFRDQSSYRRFLNHYFPDVPYRRALYIRRDGVGIVLAYYSRQVPVDLRHECTHALLHATLPMVPLWLDEGLAEYFEVAPTERAFGSPHLNGVRWTARLGFWPRLENLEDKRDISEMGGSEYQNAWAWVHFMIHGPEDVHGELVRYLADIEAQTPPGLLSLRLKRRLPDLQRRFVGHFRHWKP